MEQEPESLAAQAAHAAPSLLPEDGAPETYDPADYRWVPVRRRPRYDDWTEEKQRRFIEVLADTGLVGAAAKEVGMSRETAYRLRRAPHGAAFARAWDAARHHAGGLVEDVAFERAFEGVEHNVYDEHGDVIATKRAYNDRLLMFLLRHLRPDRYGADAPARNRSAEGPTVEASLQAMEPLLPAPPEQLLGLEELGHELEHADLADGDLPHFFREQRSEKSAARIEAERIAAQEARGEQAWEKLQRREGGLSREEMVDLCRYIDPTSGATRSNKRYR